MDLIPLEIKELSYILDGGTVYVELVDSETQKHMCVFVVYPESPVIDRYFPEAETSKPVVVLAADSDSLEDGILASERELGEIVRRVSLLEGLQDRDRAVLRKSAVEYLEQVHRHRVPYYWGSAAVHSLIEKGRGGDCFEAIEDFPLPSGY